MEKRKLLAAIAVLALAMCAFVAFVPASETDAVAATNVPAVGEDGKITVDQALKLDGDAAITNGLVLNAALTIPETATLTINYAFQASETGTNESVITFGTGGQLIVEGKVIINASNESGYTPGDKATNHILFKEGGYSSTADIQVKSGSLEMNMDKAVKGALNNGKFYLDVDGGNVKFNGNSVTTMYIVQDGGSIEFVQNDGSVMAYIDMNGGSMTVSGTNTTGSAADTPNPYIFVPYAMDIASGATLNVNGAMSIYAKEGGALDSTLPEGHGLTISTVTNAGKINVDASGSINVPAGATMDLGTINSSGNVDVAVDEKGIEAALKNPAVDSIVYTGTTAPATAITKELTVTNASAMDGAIVGENGKVTFAPATEGGSVSIAAGDDLTVNYADAGTVKIAVASDKTFSASSIQFYYGSEGVIIDKSQGEATITYNSTTGKIQGTITSGNIIISGSGTVTIDRQGLTLGNDATLTIDSEVTLKAGSNLKVAKDATEANLAVEGVLEYTSIPDIVKVTGNGTIKVEGGQGTENIISVSQDVNGTYYLTADTTILSGVTLTVPRNAVLNLMGYDLIVEGTLVVENRGTVTSGVGAVDSSKVGNIVLTATGAIQNDGTIGDRMPISIANGERYDQTDKVYDQTVTVQGVSGINFQLIRSIDDGKRVYDMAVSGEVSAVKGVAESSVTLKNVDINGNMTVDDNIDFTIAAGTTKVTGNNTVFTFDGDKMTVNGTFILTNGTSAVLNSEVVGKIYAQTGHMGDDGKLVADKTGSPAVPVTYVEFKAPEGKTGEADNNATAVGMTISVSKVTVVEKDKSVIYQRMFVSGDIDAAIVSTSDAKDVVGNATVNFAGNVYINESLTFTEDVTVNITGYTFMVSEGGVVEAVSTNDPGLSYNGAKYVIEAEKSSDPDTYYYTTFDAAMQNIATAADGIVTVNGDFTINGTYTVADNQEIAKQGNTTAVKVGEGSVITVEVGGYIDNLAIFQILGKVVVLEGDGYEPEATYNNSTDDYIYAVMTEDAETLDVTYSGLKTAMDEATAGQTIEVVGSADYDGDLVIPNGVTLKVNEGLTLTVTGDVTVENGGKLILDASTLAVGEVDDNGTGSENVVTVAGELDASEAVGITAVTGAKSVNIYSTGKITSATAVGGGVVKMNAAYYNDGEFVYTSLANAVAYAEENALPTGVNVTGTFTETGAVESDGVSIVVDNGANVTLGDLTLNNAKISSAAATSPAVQGTYTATITALNGAGDAAADATVAVSKTSATVESKVTLNAEGTSQYALQIDNLAGANVQAGTVTYIGGSFTVDKENGLTVSSGATLLIGENATLTNKDAVMVNNGTIQIAEKKTLTVEGTLAGNVNVPKDATLKSVADGMTITGTVTVDAQGSFQADGKLQMGAAPELLTDTAAGAVVGKLTLADNEAYIVAFAGADMSQADIVLNGDVAAELKNTAYQINGIDFVTVYTFGSIDIDGTTGNAVYDAVKGLKDLNTDAKTGTYDIVWYAGETKITNEKVGEYAQVSTEIRYRTVDVTVSAGPQITISIDGVVWNGYDTLPLTIGTHTVSAVVNPGYTGDITITFNGQTVTNGQFEITSDMMDSLDQIVLSATGNITQDSTTVITGGDNGSSDMGLTDYLLIVLVILIVIMAIIVALRLMRS